jgi:hypothetical protein
MGRFTIFALQKNCHFANGSTPKYLHKPIVTNVPQPKVRHAQLHFTTHLAKCDRDTLDITWTAPFLIGPGISEPF